MTPPLRIDPIAEARRHWEARWEAEPSRAMAAVTSLMRAQQVLMARLNDLLRPLGLTFPRYEALMLLSFTRAGALPLGYRAPAVEPFVALLRAEAGEHCSDCVGRAAQPATTAIVATS